MRELLNYDAETGEFVWRVRRRKVSVGDVAGYISSAGYRYICIDQKDYRAGHLAWLWMTGNWPEIEIDHKDRVRANDAWSNLRQATRSQNLTNRRVMSNNLLGVKGVYFRYGKYCATVYVNRKAVWLGAYTNIADASAAVRAGGAKYHGEFYNPG